MCKGSWRRCTVGVREPIPHIQQSLIKLLIGFMLCFFTFSWFQLCLLQEPSCQQHLSCLQEQPFRLLVWGCWTPDFPFYLLDSPLYHSRHSTLDCQPCKGAASLLGSSGSVCPILPHVLQWCCERRLWGCCLILAVQHSLCRFRACSFPRASHSVHGSLLWFKTQHG